MAKDRADADNRYRSPQSSEWVKRDSAGTLKKSSAPGKGLRREVLFPTEPSTIGDKKIDRAIRSVIARKK